MDIDRWQRTASGNSTTAPDGFPEGMTRQDVNDSAREVMAAAKRFYDSPDFRNPFRNFTLTRTTGTVWILVDGGGQTNAGQFLELNQRVKMVISTNPTVDYWEGWVSALPAYGAPNQNVTFTWIAAESKDAVGPTTATNCVLTVGPKELGQAAWYDTGTGATQIPLGGDIKPYALATNENALDVGFVQGLTALEIAEAATRGRLNANGGMLFWSRGVSFTNATVPLNSDNNSIADNWTLLSDGNDRVNITREADAPGGVPVRYSMKFTTAAGVVNQKYGAITFAELDDALDVGSPSSTKKVSASFWIKQGSIAGIKSVRAYLLNIKTATPTNDPISAWGSGSEGSDVAFNATDWEQVGASLDVDLDAIGSAWTEYKIEDVSMAGGGAGPIAMAFITDDAVIGASSSWHIAAVQINRGVRALPFLPEPVALERARCERYYESTFDDEAGVYPAAALGATHALAVRSTEGTQRVIVNWPFRVPKFKVPTIATYNPRVAGTGFDDLAASSVPVGTTNTNRKQVHLISDATAANDTTYYIGIAAAAQIWGNG
jgi:hypothetical protein